MIKKKILSAIFVAAFLLVQTVSANAMRYFMQGDKPGSKTPYGNNQAVGKYLQVGDAKIYYEVYGEGKPVFIFHGGGVGSSYELGKIIDDLRENFQVIAISTRGHGRSEIGNSPLTYEQKADDMVAVMKEITSAPAQIVGFSDGAYTAYKVAVMYPERVERIVAIGAGTLKPGFFSGEMKVDDMKKFDKDFMEIEMQIRPEPERIQEFYDKYMNFWSRMSVGEEIFGKIKCPVLLIVGDEDDHAPVATVLEAHQMIPDSSLLVVPEAWHSAFNDNYEVVRPALLKFVNTPVKELKGSKKVEYNSKFKIAK